MVDSKMTVLITDMNVAGAQKMVLELMPYFAKEYSQCKLIVLNPNSNNQFSKELNGKGIDVVYMERKPQNYLLRKLFTWRFLRRELDYENPDLIFANLDYVYIWIYSYIRKKRIIQTFHTQPFRIASRYNKKFLNKLRDNGLIRPILLTESGRDEFCRIFNFEKNLVDIIPNPVDFEKYAVEHIVSDEIRISNIGRFHSIKNQQLLIKAFSEALCEIPKMKLFFAGDGETIDECHKLVHSLNIDDNVVFLGEINDVPELLSQTDIFVISSRSEAFPIVLLEAMAAGLPIIATRVGGMRDVVKDNGLLVSLDDTHEMKKALVTLSKDIKLREEMGKKSREIAKEFSLEKTAKKYLGLFYEELENVTHENKSV